MIVRASGDNTQCRKPHLLSPVYFRSQYKTDIPAKGDQPINRSFSIGSLSCCSVGLPVFLAFIFPAFRLEQRRWNGPKSRSIRPLTLSDGMRTGIDSDAQVSAPRRLEDTRPVVFHRQPPA